MFIHNHYQIVYEAQKTSYSYHCYKMYTRQNPNRSRKIREMNHVE